VFENTRYTQTGHVITEGFPMPDVNCRSRIDPAGPLACWRTQQMFDAKGPSSSARRRAVIPMCMAGLSFTARQARRSVQGPSSDWKSFRGLFAGMRVT